MKGVELFFFVIVVFFVGSTLARKGAKGPRRRGLKELHSLDMQLTPNEEFIGPFEEGLMENRGEHVNGPNYRESMLKGKKKKNPTSKNKG